MKRIIAMLLTAVVCSLPATAQTAQTGSENQGIQSEIEQLKKSLATIEQKLEDQQQAAEAEKKKAEAEAAKKQEADKNSVSEQLKADIKNLDHRVTKTERKAALDRINWSGDIRTESNTIFGNIPTHYDGMQLQSLLVKSMWMGSPTSQGGLGVPISLGGLPANPADYANMLKGALAANYGAYQYFTNNLTFDQVKGFFRSFTPLQQQQFQSYLQGVPGVLVPAYGANANEIATERLRLDFDAHVSDNVDVSARLAMYKVFGDSTNVQVFDGQPTSINLDGTTASVPTGDFVRVERAYFTWKNLAGLPMYISIGRRPSTDGPPLNYRLDEPRGGTPSGALINYQFDGATFGYHIGDKTALRLCYGLGYDSGFGNGQIDQLPADRVKGVQFLGGNFDLYATDTSLVQVTIARAWNVTDGFNGLVVLPNNPLTGDPISGGVVMRYTPSANVGDINLYGIVVEKTVGSFDLYASLNMDSLRPNGVTTPFGGLGSNPFDTPTNHNGSMVYAGFRYKVQQSGRTKIGFEYNHGSKYWFNFAQAEDDIFAPKTQARGDVYESFITHRISNHFILKGDYQRFHYNWSGSGWDVGAPERLSSTPLLGFPTYDRGTLLTAGLTARF